MINTLPTTSKHDRDFSVFTTPILIYEPIGPVCLSLLFFYLFLYSCRLLKDEQVPKMAFRRKRSDISFRRPSFAGAEPRDHSQVTKTLFCFGLTLSPYSPIYFIFLSLGNNFFSFLSFSSFFCLLLLSFLLLFSFFYTFLFFFIIIIILLFFYSFILFILYSVISSLFYPKKYITSFFLFFHSLFLLILLLFFKISYLLIGSILLSIFFYIFLLYSFFFVLSVIPYLFFSSYFLCLLSLLFSYMIFPSCVSSPTNFFLLLTPRLFPLVFFMFLLLYSILPFFYFSLSLLP